MTNPISSLKTLYIYRSGLSFLYLFIYFFHSHKPISFPHSLPHPTRQRARPPQSAAASSPTSSLSPTLPLSFAFPLSFAPPSLLYHHPSILSPFPPLHPPFLPSISPIPLSSPSTDLNNESFLFLFYFLFLVNLVWTSLNDMGFE